MEIAKVIGRKIDELRELRGMTQMELGELLGVTRQTISNYLAGNQIIDSGKLFKLARYFGKSLDYFLCEDEEPAPLTLMFRAAHPNENDQASFDKVIRRFKLYEQALMLVGQKVSFLPSSHSLQSDGESLCEQEKGLIEDIAYKQRQFLGIDGAVGQSLFSVLEDAGFNIVAFPLEAEIWGMSAHSDIGPFIYVNDASGICEERKIFSLAHELGHLILDRRQYSSSHFKHQSARKDVHELAADHFAACFLLPRERLKQESNLGIPLNSMPQLLRLKQKYNVSIQTLIRSLNEYGLLSNSSKIQLFRYLSAKGYRKTEPHPISYVEKGDKLIRLVQHLYLEGQIGPSKVAELLDISLQDARSLTREWGVQD